MCQILHLPANYNLRDDLLESTCVVNPDGFGYMYFNGSEVVADKFYTGKNNTPDDIKEALKDIKDVPVWLHLRHATKGEITKDQAHPFLVSEEHSLWFMHNGTVSGWGSKEQSDTEHFGQYVVGPLYDRLVAAGVEHPLKDGLFIEIMNTYADNKDKFVFMDKHGHYLISNEYKSDQYTDKEANVEFWVSNTYSFDEFHRNPQGRWAKYDHINGYASGGSSKGFRDVGGSSTEGDLPFTPGLIGPGATSAVKIQTGNGSYPVVVHDLQKSTALASTTQIIQNSTTGSLLDAYGNVLSVNGVDTTPTGRDGETGKSPELVESPAVELTPEEKRKLFRRGTAVEDFPRQLTTLNYTQDILAEDFESLFYLELEDLRDLVEWEKEHTVVLLNELIYFAYNKCMQEAWYDSIEDAEYEDDEGRTSSSWDEEYTYRTREGQ